MSDELPHILDLVALTADLSSRPDCKRIAVVARKALHAQSCSADVSMAEECCRSLRALKAAEIDEVHRYTIEAALLGQAVLLYARATLSTGQYGERGGSNVREVLPDELKADHDKIKLIRARVIAHVYSDEDHGGIAWHGSRLWAVETRRGWLPAGAKQTVSYDRETLEALERVTAAVHPILIERFRQRLAEVTDTLNAAAVWPSVTPYLRQAADYFGNEHDARIILQSGQPGAAVTILSGQSRRQ